MNILLILFGLIFFPSIATGQNYTNTGMNGLGGQIYDHVIVSAGNNNNPLTNFSQVGFWAALTCNSYATGHCGGFESSNGLADGVHTARMDSFGVATPHMGTNSVADRFIQFAYSEALAGTNNAIIAAVDDNNFTGNWFINYRGSLPSKIMGDIGIGRSPDAVANARSVVMDGPQLSFIRIYINGSETGRITVNATSMWFDNFGTGPITFRTRNGVALVLNVDGSVTMPQLAGSGSRTVRVDSSGTLSAQ
jgi:hypothetical protein